MGSASSKRRDAELASRDAEIALLKAKIEEMSTVSVEKAAPSDVVADTIVPFTSQALMGSTLGYATGFALKTMGRVAGFTVGSSFILLQGLSYMGFIKVDWLKVEREYVKRMDRNNDGKVGHEDLQVLWREMVDVLAFNLPAGGAFTGGLLYGLNFVPATTAAGVATVGSLGARFVLPRVALAGAGATGLPAVLVGAKHQLFPDDDDDSQIDPDSLKAQSAAAQHAAALKKDEK